MTVVDASVVVDLLLDLAPFAEVIARRVARDSPSLAAPHLLDAEVLEALRRRTRSRGITPARAAGALEDLRTLPIVRYPHTPLLDRAYALRGNVTAYDALYLALAEALDAPLVTRDAALRRVPGCAAAVEVIAAT